MACNQYVKPQRPTDPLKLDDLPTEVLYHMFELCDSESLRNLSMSCKRFNDIIWDDFIWKKQSSSCIITNQLCSKVCKRYGMMYTLNSEVMLIRWSQNCHWSIEVLAETSPNQDPLNI